MNRYFNKKTALTLSSLAIAAVLFVAPRHAHAVSILPTVESVVDFLNTGARAMMELIILPLAAGMFSLVGMLFDAAINFSLHTAYIFSLSPAINLGWVIIRDIANILFIFVLIYISLGTIIKGSIGFHTKDLLKNVIIAALLINFSLFFTKIVIDGSNIMGNWLYGGITKTLEVNKKNPESASAPAPSLSDLINARLGIIQLWSNAQANSNTANRNFFNNPENTTISQFIRLAVVLIAIYIFAYCAIMFLARSITLLFLMVFSPIGFMGGLLPQLKKYSGQWRDELFSAAIFPIAFLLMLYISLQFINSLSVLNINPDSRITLYFQYFIIIFVLNATLKIAKDNSGEMGKALGGMAEGLGKTITGVALGAATGGAGLAMRATVGRSAAALADSEFAKNMVGSKSKTISLLGSGLRGSAKWTSKQSFDTSKAAGGFISDVGGIKTAVPKWMQSPKDGYVGAQKARTKAERELAGELYTTPEQEKLLAAAKNESRQAAERDVAGTSEARENADQIDALKKKKAEQAKEIKDIQERIKENDFEDIPALEAKLRTLDQGTKETENGIRELENSYAQMVDAKINSILAEQAKENTEIGKSLASALKAQQRLENYAKNIETDQVSGSFATAATALTGAGALGYTVYTKSTKENKALADRIRKDKAEGYIKRQKDAKENLGLLKEVIGGGNEPKKEGSGSEK